MFIAFDTQACATLTPVRSAEINADVALEPWSYRKRGVCCMHVVFSFTINQSKRKQIDEHIFNFEQYHAAKKQGHQTKPRDADTAGVNATDLKVRYPQNPFVIRKTVESLHIHTILITQPHTMPPCSPTCSHAQENEVNSKEGDDLQNSLSSRLRSATSSTTHNAGL